MLDPTDAEPELRSQEPRLERRLTLPILVLYGMGTTIGAGIYALTGAVAGTAGMYAPIAFALAAVLAGFTALSLAELSARFPRAAGEAHYVQQGYGAPRLATIVGLAVALAGAISAATVTRGFAAYVETATPVSGWIWIVGMALIAGGVAARGIAEAAWLAALLTLVEIAGLLIVIFVTRGSLAELPDRIHELIPPFEPEAWTGILAASVLCFYAFLGFEDMVNVAEEVRDVRRTLPLAIVWTLVGTLVLYVALAVAAVLAAPPAELASSEAPLALLYQRATGNPPYLLSAIGSIAMSNGVLIQVVKASRVLYGLADQGALPRLLARVHPRTRTPINATAIVTGVVVVLALAFPLAALARVTSLITLGVFALICGALFRLRSTPPPASVRRTPPWIPATGFVVSIALLVYDLVTQVLS